MPRSHHKEVAANGDPPYPRPFHPPFNVQKFTNLKHQFIQETSPFDVRLQNLTKSLDRYAKRATKGVSWKTDAEI